MKTQRMVNKRLVIFAAMTVSLSLAACSSFGGLQSDPNHSDISLKGKNVTFICPWEAGGSSDAMTRKVAELFGKATGANTSVENQGGAGGTTATTDFVEAAPDGTSVCLEAVGVFTLQPFVREVGYSIDDFTPVAGLTTEPIIMVASKASGITGMDSLLAKGTINYGFNGTGSIMELCQRKFFSMTELTAAGVSYDGSSETIAALLGGHIDVAVAHPAEISQYMKTGDLKAIGIFNKERDTREGLKEIPTFLEQGYDVNMAVWKFMIIPKGTSPEMASYLTTTLDEVVTGKEFETFCESYALLPTQQSPSEIVERIKSEAEVNKQLLEK